MLGGRGRGERWVALRAILEEESTVLADELTTDSLIIIFIIIIITYSSFPSYSQPSTLQIFPLWSWALAPKAFCTQFSSPSRDCNDLSVLH